MFSSLVRARYVLTPLPNSVCINSGSSPTPHTPIFCIDTLRTTLLKYISHRHKYFIETKRNIHIDPYYGEYCFGNACKNSKYVGKGNAGVDVIVPEHLSTPRINSILAGYDVTCLRMNKCTSNVKSLMQKSGLYNDTYKRLYYEKLNRVVHDFDVSSIKIAALITHHSGIYVSILGVSIPTVKTNNIETFIDPGLGNVRISNRRLELRLSPSILTHPCTVQICCSSMLF